MARHPKANAGLKNAVKSADFDPKRILAAPKDVQQLKLGTLIGEAIKTFFQPDLRNPEEMQEGLLGTFQFTNVDEERETMRGPKLWVPDTISNPIKDALRSIDPETGEVTPKAHSVEFAFDVFAIRSSAPVGYTWLFRPLGNVVERGDDPIIRITKRVEEEMKALPAPEPEAPKASAKK